MLRAIKEKYWDYAYRKSIDAKLGRPENAHFARYVKQESGMVSAAAATDGIEELDVRVQAAIEWLLRAQSATPDGRCVTGLLPHNVGAGVECFLS